MPRSVWNDIVSWRTWRLQQLYKVSTPCIDDHHFKEEEVKSVGRIVKIMLSDCPKILIWHVLDDLIFGGQWTNLHDRSQNGPTLVTNDNLVWSLTFIIHVTINNIVMWETLQNYADWDCFKTPILQEILRTQNLILVEHYVFLEVIRLFQSVGCARNKLQFHTVQQNQTSFSWTQDWGWTVYPNLIYGTWSSQFFTEIRIRTEKNGETRCWSNVKLVLHLTRFTNASNLKEWSMILDNVDFVSSNVQSSHQEALLYVFEDNEAVIKMIIKGRSLTMRHVSRTHRVALDWLFDGINLDAKIQNQIHLTPRTNSYTYWQGNFTRDEWNHLLCLFNISHFSSINSLEAMSKRTQEDAGEERVTAKSMPMMNLVSRYSARDPNVLFLYCIRKPGENQIWKSNTS